MRIVFLIVLDYHCNNDATAMITNILYCVLSVIQGIALNTGILPFSKGRVLQRSHKALQSNSSIFILIMGSQPSSNFLGIEASSFNFSSLICIMALVICFVKATFISLVLGVSASFCKNLITSVTLQPSKSKSFSSKVKGQLAPIFLKISAHLSGVF